MRNSVSFDLEHWYTATLLVDEVEDPTERIAESTDIVLDLLRAHGVEATFFVVGRVAEEHPELVRRIADAGHEIGSHGQTHRTLFDLSPAEFERELAASADAIEAATGRAPVGFRAPNFSVTERTRWAFDVLEESEYRYDSSVFPTKTPMYGVSGGPQTPYRVTTDAPFDAAGVGDPTSLVECPLAVTNTPVRLPIAGGFYARVAPVRLLEEGIRRLNRAGHPATLYFHPWEFNPNVPVSSPRFDKRFVSFSGIDGLTSKVERLFDRFDFGPVRETITTALGNDALEEPTGESNGRNAGRNAVNRWESRP